MHRETCRPSPKASIVAPSPTWPFEMPTVDAAPVLLETISVVLPAFNAGAWIEAALESVLSQDWPALDVVVVDDGSSDGSAELVERRFPQVRLLRQRNSGVAAARNAGVRAARGRWVAFIDADDYWLPEKLRTQMTLLSASPGARLSCTPWFVWTSDEPHPPADWLDVGPPADLPASGFGPSGWIYPELLLSCSVWTSTVLAERSLLVELQGFDHDFRVGEDYDLWLRASRITPVLRADRPLALYRQHPGSLTRRAPIENYEGLVVQRALKRWGYAGPDGRKVDLRAVQQSLARTWHDYGAANLAKDRVRSGFKGAWQALRADLRHVPAWKLTVKCIVWPLWRRWEGSLV